MNCRNDCLEKLREETKKQLIQLMTGNAVLYKETLKKLIMQGMIKLLEDNVELLCKKGEESLVKDLIPECE